LTYSADDDSYKDKANYFLDDVSKKIYGSSLPWTGSEHPVPTSELYKNYLKLGYALLPDNVNNTGALALWPGVGGVVVDDSEAVVRVLYPSASRDGKLNVLYARFMSKEYEPRYLVPSAALKSAKTTYQAPVQPAAVEEEPQEGDTAMQ